MANSPLAWTLLASFLNKVKNIILFCIMYPVYSFAQPIFFLNTANRNLIGLITEIFEYKRVIGCRRRGRYIDIDKGWGLHDIAACATKSNGHHLLMYIWPVLCVKY